MSKTTTDGQPPMDGMEHASAPQPIGDDGQHRAYWILSAEERAKGFVRPVRLSYTHLMCGTVTTMGRAIAETYARQPSFYGATFCVACGGHFKVGVDGQFVWTGYVDPDGYEEKVGT